MQIDVAKEMIFKSKHTHKGASHEDASDESFAIDKSEKENIPLPNNATTKEAMLPERRKYLSDMDKLKSTVQSEISEHQSTKSANINDWRDEDIRAWLCVERRIPWG